MNFPGIMRTADSELKDIGKQRGMEIWRIKNFALEKLSSEQFGSFYVGDSYILLYTINPGEWNVHFWLGNETTQDEQGAAAIMTVKIDDSLNGLPVQYRESKDMSRRCFYRISKMAYDI
ncbi:Gelsolin-like protein [Dirofilaria immitis]